VKQILCAAILFLGMPLVVCPQAVVEKPRGKPRRRKTAGGVTPDAVHAWEILGEAVRAANSAETFNGEDTWISAQVWTREGPKIRGVKVEDMGLGVILRALAKEEPERSIELAKSFKNEKPRAAAILTIADAALEKPAAPAVGSLQ